MKFITGEPALQIGKTLVIADLHLGIEYDFHKSGIKLPSQMPKLLGKIRGLVKSAKAERLIILGDVKHKVPGTSFQEGRELPEFFGKLSKIVEVHVVPGNHDGGIGKLLPEGIRLHPTTGFLLGDAYLCHGHAWPGEDFLKARFIVTGHSQPLVEFRDILGYRWAEKVWVRSPLKKQPVEARYKLKAKHLPEHIIIPAFNEFSGGVAINTMDHNPLGPVARCDRLSSARVYLLDGTYLGLLKGLMLRE